jgi:vacuolar-type H+-ATPase subunit F/Vma7
MSVVAFIGDELTAAGFRLAGAGVHVVPPEGAPEALRTAREGASLVLLAATHARRIEAAELDRALTAAHPLTLIVDDILEQAAPPDLERMMRRALGVEVA